VVSGIGSSGNDGVQILEPPLTPDNPYSVTGERIFYDPQLRHDYVLGDGYEFVKRNLAMRHLKAGQYACSGGSGKSHRRFLDGFCGYSTGAQGCATELVALFNDCDPLSEL